MKILRDPVWPVISHALEIPVAFVHKFQMQFEMHQDVSGIFFFDTCTCNYFKIIKIHDFDSPVQSQRATEVRDGVQPGACRRCTWGQRWRSWWTVPWPAPAGSWPPLCLASLDIEWRRWRWPMRFRSCRRLPKNKAQHSVSMEDFVEHYFTVKEYWWIFSIKIRMLLCGQFWGNLFPKSQHRATKSDEEESPGNVRQAREFGSRASFSARTHRAKWSFSWVVWKRLEPFQYCLAVGFYVLWW